jgi:4-amino-4-deoxychorismate lyase
MPRALVNGVAASGVPVEDRGLAYGDGLFETIALRAGRLRFVDAHLARLADGCRRLGIPAPDAGRLQADLAAVSAGTAHGVVKLIVTRGPGPRGYAPPPAPTPSVIVLCHPGTPPAMPPGPLRVRFCQTPVSVSPALAGLKTLNRLEQVLARAEWTDPAIGEGLMRDADGCYAGGTASNLFIVAGGRLLTPGVGRRGVRGIMRGIVLAAAERLGLPVAEADLYQPHLDGASEMFLTSALIGVAPIGMLGDRELPLGPVTRELVRELAALGVEECAALPSR